VNTPGSAVPLVDELASGKKLVRVNNATIRFAGDSGDGMQLIGMQFADIASLVGNIICTLPDYPSEIRAPAGSLAGVSGYQLNFADHDIATPGDAPFVLVAMNPAALKVNLSDLQEGGVVVANEDEFTPQNLAKAGYDANPLEDGSLDGYRAIAVPMTRLNEDAAKHTDLSRLERSRCKNFFALGMMLWLYDRPIQPVLEWLLKKFANSPAVVGANGSSLRAGYNYANTAELFRVHYHVAEAELAKGRYRRLTGNEAIVLGCIAAADRLARTLVYASYPITPASEILHELSRHLNFGVRVIQAEDEIAACCAAIGASFAGAVGVTGTSGPGLSLKSESIGLAVMTELPLVVIDVQRAGPSTGLPTKTEQTDLGIALYGRHGECPVPVLAAATAEDCFYTAYESVRLATKYMTPVLLLSDSFLANSSGAFRIPSASSLPDLRIEAPRGAEGFAPYRRDPVTLARPWATPGMAGMLHRVGGLEGESVTGKVSYDGENHQQMVHERAAKIARIADDIPPAAVSGEDAGELLVIGWGSTYGAIAGAVHEMRLKGRPVSHLHLRYIHPLPRNMDEVLSRFRQVLVPENNLGQLRSLLGSRFPRGFHGLNKVDCRPFRIREVTAAIEAILSGRSAEACVSQ